MAENKTDPEADRRELYHRIRGAMQGGVARYYMDHPERLLDVRGAEAMENSLKGLGIILKIIDEYDIRKRDDRVPQMPG
jgi:hypothetical protein